MQQTQLISSEIQILLREDIIEESQSPWRAQLVGTTNERHKKRMVVDCSQTINQYTQLDAYPLPRIDELINKVERNTTFRTIDLKNAYYQIPINEIPSQPLKQQGSYIIFQKDAMWSDEWGSLFPKLHGPLHNRK